MRRGGLLALALLALPGCIDDGARLTTWTPTTPSPLSYACGQPAPAASPDVAQTRHGDYDGQRLPGGWSARLATEAEVDAAIAREASDDPGAWDCFRTFYAGAHAVYMHHQAAGR